MIAKQEMFHSRLMLFGEYSVLHGSKALAVPLRPYSGYLDYINPDDRDTAKMVSNKLLTKFSHWLDSLPENEIIPNTLRPLMIEVPVGIFASDSEGSQDK